MHKKKVLVIASHNEGKIKELRAALKPLEIDIKSSGQFYSVEPTETGASFEENAQIKAHYAYQATGLPCLADDSGLEVNALDKAPGIYSARWAGEHKDFKTACSKIITLLTHSPDRSAQFVCVLAYADKNGILQYFKGICKGSIAKEMRGDEGFGYDPIFIPEGGTKTFAQYTQAEKNNISHRAKALNAFKNYITTESL